MSDGQSGNVVTHTPTAKRLLSAFAVSGAALCYAIMGLFKFGNLGTLGWVVLGPLLIFATATAICVVTADADQAESLSLLGASIRWCESACRWVAPMLWLYTASSLTAYVVGSYVPMFQANWWVQLAITVILAGIFGSLDLRGRWFILLILMLQIALAASCACGWWVQKHHRTTAPAEVVYTLDENGNPVPTAADSLTTIDPAGTSGSTVTFQYHASVAATVRSMPLSVQVGMMLGSAVFFAMAIFEFISELRNRVSVRGRGVRAFALLLLIILQVGQNAWVQRESQSPTPSGWSFFASGDTPLGDTLQLLGAYLFGSARAGWWMMACEAIILVLVLAASMTQTIWSSPAQARPGVRWGRVSVAAGFCAIAFWMTNPPLSGFSTTSLTAGSGLGVLEGLLCTAMFAVMLLVIVFNSLVCFSCRRREQDRIHVAYLVGISAGFALISTILIPVFYMRDGLGIDAAIAIGLCAAWASTEYLRTKNTRLVGLRRQAGQCLNCGYDLRSSRIQCPECGTPFSRKQF